MKKTNTPESNFERPLTEREELAKQASMGPVRTHGRRLRKPMVKNRTVKIDSSRSASRFNKISASFAGLVAVTGLFAMANESRNEAEATINDLPKVEVTVDSGDTIEGLVKEEVSKSLSDPSRIDEISITPLIDKVVEWHGGSSEIHPNEVVILPDYPDEPGSVSYDARQSQK